MLETEHKITIARTIPRYIPDPVDVTASLRVAQNTSDRIAYDDAQWGKIAEIVEREGLAARERLEAKRVLLEKMIVALKPRLDETEKEARAKEKNRVRRYQEIAAAAAVLRRPNLARVMGNDLEWKRLSDREHRLENFASTLDYIHRVAEKRMASPRYSEDKWRNLLFKRLGQFWEEDLELEWKDGDNTRMTQFIAAACGGVCDCTLSTIGSGLRNQRKADLKWAAKVTIKGVKILSKDK